MKNRRLIIALLISCVLLCCTAQAVTLRISVVDEQTDDALVDASIYVNGDYVGTTASDGTYSYVHSGKKDLYLKVVRKGYRNWVEYVDYDATRVEVDMVREDETLTFELYDAATLKPVVGAVVRVEGTDYSDSEVTGSSGLVNFPVKAGELYNVEIRASGYYDLSKTVQMENSDRVVQYWLFSNDLLAIQVRDAETLAPLKGAEVYIDNARAGVTDADGRLPLHLERAKRYSFRVTAPDYQPYQESRYLEVDDVLFTVDLSKSAYPVSITAFDEATKPIAGAEVYLNGTLKGKTSQYGRFMLSDIHAGTYEIVVRASGYQDWSETRQISGQGEDIVAELGYDRASVTIRAKDPDQKAVANAVVVIDGRVIGTTDGQGCLNTALVTNKAYAVTAACEGYRNISVDAEIPLGTAEFTVPLVMEKDFNVWVLVAGVGVVAAVLLGAVMVVRRRRAGRNRGKSRGRDSL
ncbi:MULTISPECIES: carboxypeptidase regulatory-like domain-containing protein [unclassified Methanoculleus]|uniref:carboxypeptidase regulatory-like domain-containing protein n=1 Tax=unclassified Methanoculleus TaxID=2619537 RepID=UPI0025F27194|nr:MULTISPECIES: carboxypeptidase regulatory-like domain-containing protein [unclassified Methanoculleus]